MKIIDVFQDQIIKLPYFHFEFNTMIVRSHHGNFGFQHQANISWGVYIMRFFCKQKFKDIRF